MVGIKIAIRRTKQQGKNTTLLIKYGVFIIMMLLVLLPDIPDINRSRRWRPLQSFPQRCNSLFMFLRGSVYIVLILSLEILTTTIVALISCTRTENQWKIWNMYILQQMNNITWNIKRFFRILSSPVGHSSRVWSPILTFPAIPATIKLIWVHAS